MILDAVTTACAQRSGAIPPGGLTSPAFHVAGPVLLHMHALCFRNIRLNSHPYLCDAYCSGAPTQLFRNVFVRPASQLPQLPKKPLRVGGRTKATVASSDEPGAEVVNVGQPLPTPSLDPCASSLDSRVRLLLALIEYVTRILVLIGVLGVLWQYVHAFKGLALPQAWSAGVASPSGLSRYSDSRVRQCVACLCTKAVNSRSKCLICVFSCWCRPVSSLTT